MLVLAILVGLIALYWAACCVAVARTAWSVPRIEALAPRDPPRWPRLSVIVAARDEAESVERALETKLAQDYPDLEVVAVDDRSADATGAILDAVASRDSRVRVVHVAELPEGWLGKLWAMQQGLEASAGEWLLFSDADVHLAPGTLRRVVAWCEERGVDHVAAAPTIWSSGFVLDSVIAVFLRTLLVGGRAWAVPDPRSRAAVGAGAFNLVRRSALERTPGLAWLRLEVVDDVALAQMLKRSGARAAVLNGRGCVSLHFYRSLREMLVGTEKNFFAIVGRFRMGRLAVFAALAAALELLPWVALASGGVVAAVAAAALALEAAATVAAARWLRHRLAPALAFPIGTLGLFVMTIRSGVVAMRRGGIVWRKTLYPLDQLRAGQRLELL